MNPGASGKKKLSEKNENNIPTQNLNFVELNSNNQSSARSIELFTPPLDMRLRGFAGSQIKRPMFITQNTPINEFGEFQSQSSDQIQSHQVIWGTNVNVHEFSQRIRNFLVSFKSKDDNDSEETYYLRQLKEIKNTEIYILNIDGNHLQSFDRQLYTALVNYPTEIIPIMDGVSTQVYLEIYSNYSEARPNVFLQVRINSLANKSRIRDLNPSDIDKLISITGITIRNSDIVPEMKEAYFKCAVCSKVEISTLQRSKITEPNECNNCKSKFSFDLVHNRSVYLDKQHVKLQETPEHMPEGETPLTVHLCCYDELVDYVKPGDRCEIVGIFRASGMRINPNQRVTRSIYRTYIDVVSFTKQSRKRLNNEDKNEDQNGNDLNEEYKESLKQQVAELAQNPDIYNILVDSFAPSIWENEDVKKGLLLQLFGGVSKDFRNSGRGRFRGDINILLVGDPSTAKSQLLQYVHNLAPRGIYTSGKGSSVVGLTAYVTKDPETKEVILESGALVLSDRGICCIDEFDKMDENTRVILHEAMEQQTISIAKAGIICQLNTRTAILAAANPVHSKYATKLSVVENIRLPPTLLSRFDLIYLMLDRHNDAYDRRLANHIVSLYGRFEEEAKEIQSKYISKEVLASYISHARKLNPVISKDVEKMLTEQYVKMRSQGVSKKTISATPRQLESIIRLSEGRARLRFSPTVDLEDVDEALRLIKVATQQAATDPETGVIDMDLITTGMTTSSRNKLNQLTDTIKNILREHSDVARKGVKFSSLNEEVKKRIESLGTHSFVYSEYELRDSLKLLEEENIVALVGNKKAPIIRLIGFQYQ